jgi:hypothetical protein
MTMTTATLSRGGHDGVVRREDPAAKPPWRRFRASTFHQIEVGEAGGDPVSGFVVVTDLLLAQPHPWPPSTGLRSCSHRSTSVAGVIRCL